MIIEYCISLFIGIIGAALILSAWVWIEVLKVRNRCGRVLEIVLLSLKKDGNPKILPWYCTKEFIDEMNPLQKKIQDMGSIIMVDQLKIQLMKHVDYSLHIIIAFRMAHENGYSRAQAILYKRPSRTMVQQLAIF